MFELSLRHRLQKDFDSALDTFLFRTIFIVGVVCTYVPKPISESRSRLLYWAIILFAMALNIGISAWGFALSLWQRAKDFVRFVANLEYRVELCFRTHHFAILLACAALAVLLLNQLL